jgi:hypothetical protein
MARRGFQESPKASTARFKQGPAKANDNQGPIMNRRSPFTRVIAGLATTLAISGGLGLAGSTLGAGAAHAIPIGGDHWCPGDYPLQPDLMQQLAQLPGGLGVCQDWYFGPDGNAVGGDPGPGKPTNRYPLQAPPPTPVTRPPYCPPWATIFSGPAECGGL